MEREEQPTPILSRGNVALLVKGLGRRDARADATTILMRFGHEVVRLLAMHAVGKGLRADVCVQILEIIRRIGAPPSEVMLELQILLRHPAVRVQRKAAEVLTELLPNLTAPPGQTIDRRVWQLAPTIDPWKLRARTSRRATRRRNLPRHVQEGLNAVEQVMELRSRQQMDEEEIASSS